jgi:predicted transcriptional regulator
MGTKDSKTREHVLRQPLSDIIKSAMANGANTEELLEGIMRTLDQQKMISYCSKTELSILSPSGRVMVAIMEDSSITQRALAVYLGVTESNIQKSIKSLTDAGLITKHKDKGRNVYRVNTDKAIGHPDISRFHDGIRQIISTAVSEDESPF